AAGIWSRQIAQMVGLDLPIKPRKGHILVTARQPGLIHHPLLEGGYVTTVQSAAEDLQVALVAEMTTTGTVLLGSSRQFVGEDRTVSMKVIQAIATRASRFLPRLGYAQVIRSYAGLRPWSPDHLPLIGPVQSCPGLYLATGHEGAGIGLAPVTGKLVSDWITHAVRAEFAAALHPDRFFKT
ncbi:MAG TPA: FAD-binding oxidoreductase, partial [Anaerolineales bacterium]|nr:FAD-binding oxidoreductase [Anaerolineales bacterium]